MFFFSEVAYTDCFYRADIISRAQSVFLSYEALVRNAVRLTSGRLTAGDRGQFQMRVWRQALGRRLRR